MSQLHITVLFKVINLFLKGISVLQRCDTFRKKHSGYIKAFFLFSVLPVARIRSNNNHS